MPHDHTKTAQFAAARPGFHTPSAERGVIDEPRPAGCPSGGLGHVRLEGRLVDRSKSWQHVAHERLPVTDPDVAGRRNIRPLLFVRPFSRTVYGWLPRDKGFGDFRQLVGCGHVFGVWIAVCPRALMNVRVRLGSQSMARAMARALGAPVRTGCPGHFSVSLPSFHFALAISVRPLSARFS
jgi:hypothetical protein